MANAKKAYATVVDYRRFEVGEHNLTHGMKNLLFISYFFPPMGGSGVQRSMYFAKYLPDFGYRPIVIQGGPRPQGGPTDESLLEELHGQVLRREFPAFEPASFTRPVGRALARLGRYGVGIAWRIGVLTDRVENRLSPDALALWARRLVDRVTCIAKRTRAVAIYSTSDPYSNHYLAWHVQRQTGLPWVADFRDLWTQDWTYDPHPAFRARRDRYWERVFLRDADTVINVTEGYSRAMKTLAPSDRKDRFHVIRNGCDLSTFPPPRMQPHGSRFLLSYTGVLYRSRWSDALVKALRRLNGGALPGGGIEWRVAGRMPSDCLAKAQVLGNHFQFLGYVDHDKAQEVMMNSNALLLQIIRGRNAEGSVTGKLYEYLASGRPILCLEPGKSEAAEMIKRHKAGLVAQIDSEEGIYAALSELYGAWLEGKARTGASRDEIAQYDRRALTGRLAQVVDALLAQNTRKTFEK